MSTGDLWFSIIIIVFILLFLVLFIINAVYWNKLRSSGCGTAVSASQANLYFWLNLIAALLAAIILIWAIVRMFIRPKPDIQKLAKISSAGAAPPVVFQPVGEQVVQRETRLEPAPQLMGQTYVTSQGYSGNVIGSQGAQLLREEHELL